jgi:hypothetical protein
MPQGALVAREVVRAWRPCSRRLAPDPDWMPKRCSICGSLPHVFCLLSGAQEVPGAVLLPHHGRSKTRPATSYGQVGHDLPDDRGI